MKIALLGVSHWHMAIFIEPLMKIPGHTIVGVADPSPEAVKSYTDRLGCKGYASYKDLCREQKPDFAFALAPHADMPEMAHYLMDEGIPFSMEKPMGVTLADVEALAAKAKAKNHFVCIPFAFRNTGFLQTIRERAAGEEVQYAAFRFIAGPPTRYREAKCDWMLDPARSGGGCGINLAVHFFDFATLLWKTTDLEVKNAMVSNAAYGERVEDHFFAGLRHNGRTCLLETGYMYPAPVGFFDLHFSVRTDKHYFSVLNQDTVEVVDLSGKREFIKTTTTNFVAYPAFIQETLSRFQEGRAPVADLNDMVPVMRMLQDAYRLAGPLPGPQTGAKH